MPELKKNRVRVLRYWFLRWKDGITEADTEASDWNQGCARIDLHSFRIFEPKSHNEVLTHKWTLISNRPWKTAASVFLNFKNSWNKQTYNFKLLTFEKKNKLVDGLDHDTTPGLLVWEIKIIDLKRPKKQNNSDVNPLFIQRVKLLVITVFIH